MAQGSDKKSVGGTNDVKRDGPDGPERAGQVLGEWGSRVGRGLATAAARVREEMEDIWAEAQSVRRGEQD